MPRKRWYPGGWQHLPVSGLRGLNLLQQPDGVRPGDALDLMNVSLMDQGGVRSRPGYGALASALGAIPAFLARHVSSSGVRRLVVSTPTSLKAIDGAGSTTDTAAGGAIPTATMVSATRYASAGAERSYLGNGVDTMRRYDTSGGFGAPTITAVNGLTGATAAGAVAPKGALVCAWPNEDRLLVGGFAAGANGPGSQGAPATGATVDPSHVYVSEPGNPESFRDTTFIRLATGDGEQQQAIVSWRDLVFIFKETKYFVCTSVSVDGNGVATINRRAVDTGIGAIARGAVAVGRDGVYFVGRRGIYRTRGGDPELITPLLEPLWGGPNPILYTGGRILQSGWSSVRLAWVNERLYMAYRSDLGGATNDRLLVVDPRDGAATVWSIAASALAAFAVTGEDELVFASPGVQNVYRVSESIASDPQVMKTLWFGGFEIVEGERVARARRLALWGTGTVDAAMAVDYQRPTWAQTAALSSSVDVWGDGTNPLDTWGAGAGPDTWGAGLAMDGYLIDRAVLGSRLGLYLSTNPASLAAQKAWSVSRAVFHVQGSPPRHGSLMKAGG